jgi:hypothetical protein
MNVHQQYDCLCTVSLRLMYTTAHEQSVMACALCLTLQLPYYAIWHKLMLATLERKLVLSALLCKYLQHNLPTTAARIKHF